MPDPDADLATRPAAVEAATTQAAAAAQAAAATANALRAEMERQPKGSRSPARRRVLSPLPERRRGRGGCRGSPVAVQTVYKDSVLGALWLMLTKTNYHEWSLHIKVKMQACQL